MNNSDLNNKKFMFIIESVDRPRGFFVSVGYPQGSQQPEQIILTTTPEETGTLISARTYSPLEDLESTLNKISPDLNTLSTYEDILGTGERYSEIEAMYSPNSCSVSNSSDTLFGSSIELGPSVTANIDWLTKILGTFSSVAGVGVTIAKFADLDKNIILSGLIDNALKCCHIDLRNIEFEWGK